MKLHLAKMHGLNAISGHGEGYVEVNGERIGRSLIVLPERLVTDWPAQTIESLDESHLEAVAALEPEIVLLGTGARLRFPPPRLTRALVERRIGVEVMDTPAACRTYNILMAEGRKVAAALLVN